MPALLDHKKLRKEMEARSLKQEPLAEQLDISVRHLRNLCSRDVNISSSLLYDISVTLQVPMDELLIMPEERE
ncbi:helix-turn-helix domain-containing protein [uncultured Oscillibacter sp.]|uniref:helix-turn-helix domain-containing protein n=1 Tax=uncultured Oscillibacter sp. TaxID=876091 RepID=UPI0025D71B9C|nr:helix-turn-helix transcriptional regulator [uncultured Oscillibacter sp.]